MPDPDADPLAFLAAQGTDAEHRQRPDQHLLQITDVGANVPPVRPQVEHRVSHELTRTVVRGASAPVALGDGDSALLEPVRRRQDVAPVAVPAHRVGRRMLEQEQRVRGIGVGVKDGLPDPVLQLDTGFVTHPAQIGRADRRLHLSSSVRLHLAHVHNTTPCTWPPAPATTRRYSHARYTIRGLIQEAWLCSRGARKQLQSDCCRPAR